MKPTTYQELKAKLKQYEKTLKILIERKESAYPYRDRDLARRIVNIRATIKDDRRRMVEKLDASF